MWLIIKSAISLVVSFMLTIFPNSQLLKSADVLQFKTQEEDDWSIK